MIDPAPPTDFSRALARQLLKERIAYGDDPTTETTLVLGTQWITVPLWVAREVLEELLELAQPGKGV